MTACTTQTVNIWKWNDETLKAPGVACVNQ
jgi:hypothetical protein